MIILSKRVGQVSSNQPLGDENNGPQDSRLILGKGQDKAKHDNKQDKTKDDTKTDKSKQNK